MKDHFNGIFSFDFNFADSNKLCKVKNQPKDSKF